MEGDFSSKFSEEVDKISEMEEPHESVCRDRNPDGRRRSEENQKVILKNLEEESSP